MTSIVHSTAVPWSVFSFGNANVTIGVAVSSSTGLAATRTWPQTLALPSTMSGHLATGVLGLAVSGITTSVVPASMRRDGEGGFAATGQRALHTWDADAVLGDLYATWALVEAGHASTLRTELDRVEHLAKTQSDPYQLALAVLALAPAGRDAAARSAGETLLDLQDSRGAMPAPEGTITRSGPRDAVVETTALATRAFDALGEAEAASRARTWLASQRAPGGTWGATQATVLALDALQGWPPRVSQEPVHVALGSRVSRSLDFPTGLEPTRLPLDVRPARQWVTLSGEQGANALVWASFTTEQLPASPGSPLSLTVTVAEGDHRAGDPVRLTAVVRNTSDKVVPSPVARIGIPAGLSVAPWQLEELLEQGAAAFLEVDDGTVIAYWDGLASGEVATVPLDLTAELPGRSRGRASSAWPFYDPEAKVWTHGVQVEVARPAR